MQNIFFGKFKSLNASDLCDDFYVTQHKFLIISLDKTTHAQACQSLIRRDLFIYVPLINVHMFQGAEFDAVRPSMVECASFRGQIWFHVNFLARRRGSIDAPVLCFFAELRYYGDFVEKVSVESCVILQGM